MSQVESTLRHVNGRLVGNRNFRVSCDDDWDPQRHITMRRQLVKQETRETAAMVALEGLSALAVTLPENEGPVDDGFDYEEYRRSQEVSDDPEDFFNAVNSDELFDDTNDDYAEEFTDTLPGAITFDTDRTSVPANSEDRRWEGLQDDLDAIRDVHRNFQEHEMYMDGISGTHCYHAAQHGIIAVDRFDLYGDRNPPAWWPILECA